MQLTRFTHNHSCFFCEQNFRTGYSGLSTICEYCFNQLPKNDKSCANCAEPLTSTPNKNKYLCESCEFKPPPWDYIVAAFAYQYPTKEAIHQFKFNRIFTYGKLMVDILIGQLLGFYAHKPMPKILVPIPSHKQRIYERKFNSNLWLAKEISKTFNIQLAQNNIQKIRHTPEQNTLDYNQRQTNLQDSFKCLDGNFFRNQHIVILDDVMTTGATMRQIAHLIAEHRPATIHLWSIARTPKNFLSIQPPIQTPSSK